MNVYGRILFQLADRAYRYGFVTNIKHIPFIRYPIVVDMDDPRFTKDEIELLGSPNIVAVVVTNQPAADHYRELGLRTPIRVIGQGIEFTTISPLIAQEIFGRKKEHEISVGYVAAWHLTGSSRNVQPVYNVDHLIEDLWPAVVAACPRARLWLVGDIDDVLRRNLQQRSDIELVGPVPQDHIPAYMSIFDAAVYPRRVQHRRSAIKIAEYIGAGVPTIGYKSTPTDPIARTGAGMLVDTPTEFVSTLTRVLNDRELRERLAANARAAAAEVDWKYLGEQYNKLLNEFLPPDGE